MYCFNCPVAFEDSEGTTPELSINLNDIILFVKSTSEKIKNGLTEEYNKINKLFTNWSNALKIRYNGFVDKLEYALNYPDAVINDVLSKVFNKDVSIRFRLVELLRSQINFSFDLSWMKADVEEQNEKPAMFKSSSAEKDEHNSIISAIFQGLFGGVILNAIKDFFDIVSIDLEDIMNKSIKDGWFDTFKELMYSGVAIFSAFFLEIDGFFDFDEIFFNSNMEFADWLVEMTEDAGDLEEASKGSSFFGLVSLLSSIVSFSDKIDNAGNGVFSKNTDIVLSSISLVFDVLSLFIKVPIFDMIVSSAGTVIPKVIAMRIGGLVLC